MTLGGSARKNKQQATRNKEQIVNFQELLDSELLESGPLDELRLRIVALVRPRIDQRLRSYMDENDMAQDVLLRLKCQVAEGKFDASIEIDSPFFAAVVSTLCKNVAADWSRWIRAKKRGDGRQIQSIEGNPECERSKISSCPIASPSHSASKNEVNVIVRDVIASLSTRSRDRYDKYYREDKTSVEVANENETTPDCEVKAKWRLLRALKALLRGKGIDSKPYGRRGI